MCVSPTSRKAREGEGRRGKARKGEDRRGKGANFLVVGEGRRKELAARRRELFDPERYLSSRPTAQPWLNLREPRARISWDRELMNKLSLSV
jgi:hypothetical protein